MGPNLFRYYWDTYMYVYDDSDPPFSRDLHPTPYSSDVCSCTVHVQWIQWTTLVALNKPHALHMHRSERRYVLDMCILLTQEALTDSHARVQGSLSESEGHSQGLFVIFTCSFELSTLELVRSSPASIFLGWLPCTSKVTYRKAGEFRLKIYVVP